MVMMVPSGEASLHEFVSNQRRLLELELRAESERDEDADRDGGFCLRNIDVIDTSVGLYGRTVIQFGTTSSSDLTNVNDTVTNTASQASSKFLPAHRLTVGDEVQILPNNGRGFQSAGKQSTEAGGVICAMGDVSISVALFGGDAGNSKHKFSAKKTAKKSITEAGENYDEPEMLPGKPPYVLVPKSNVDVHQKLINALDELDGNGISHPVARDIIIAAFESENSKRNTEIMTHSQIDALEEACDLVSTRLDYSQREAVIMALYSNSPITLIHGPPGTGKTTTVAELIRCAVHRKDWRVLVTAPSNVAVDNVLDRVMSLENEKTTNVSSKRNASLKTKVKAVRIGHPARIHHGIQKYSLESLVHSSDGTEIVKDCRSELNGYLKTLSNASSRPAEKILAYREMKALRKEIRTREEKVVGEILRNSNVVFATNVGAASSLFKRMTDAKGNRIAFDLVIIDEAAQALEASCWISLLRGKRAVLAGDHKQLPPTIKSSNREVQSGLGRTLFERLMLAYERVDMGRSRMLEVQYRMHQDISDWASNAMYHGKLISHESVRNRQLATLPLVAEKLQAHRDTKEDTSALEEVTLLLIDTTGCDMHETANEAGSRYNEGEANIVASHVQSLISTGLRAEDIAVITPYNGQVELLRKILLPTTPKLEIRSVDGFQGGEREAVVLSLVRSSDCGGKDGIGFLRDERRLNVAVTRAKRHCAVICDCETVSKDAFIKGLLDWIEKKGEYRSGAEFTIVHNGIGIQQPTNNAELSKSRKLSKELVARPASDRKPKKGSTETELKGGKEGEMSISTSIECGIVTAHELVEECSGTSAVEEKTNYAHTAAGIHAAKISTFEQLDDADDDDDDDGVDAGRLDDDQDNGIPNKLLQELAIERQNRQSDGPTLQTPIPPKPPSKKKKVKAKGHKLGGAQQPRQVETVYDMDDLDDIAFLDAQIEKVQTSHGRTIDAAGKGYRTIVNGILLAKPLPKDEPKRNGAAATNLQATLQSKAQDRKVKKKSK